MFPEAALIVTDYILPFVRESTLIQTRFGIHRPLEGFWRRYLHQEPQLTFAFHISDQGGPESLIIKRQLSELFLKSVILPP